MTRARNQAGFTLLEMLVAISVLGLLSVSIARGLHLGSSGFANAARQTRAADRRLDASRLLHLLLGGAYPAFAQADIEDRRIAFDGEPQSLTLVTRLPQALGPPAMVLARIFTGEVDGRPALLLRWRLDLPRADGDGSPQETQMVIAADVGAIGLGYFGAGAPGDAPRWQDRWADQSRMPLLVRLTIQDDDARKTLWPELVADLPASANTACVYDPTDVQCRRIR